MFLPGISIFLAVSVISCLVNELQTLEPGLAHYTQKIKHNLTCSTLIMDLLLGVISIAEKIIPADETLKCIINDGTER
jgi:hypothetical protein